MEHFNLTLLGKIEDGVNELTLAMSNAASRYGKVISGDYLDKKGLSGRKELFHILYHTSRYECEHICAPVYISNISKSICQADAVALIINLERGLGAIDYALLDYVNGSNIEQVIIVFSSHPRETIDVEMHDIAKMEVIEVMKNLGFNQDNIHFLFDTNDDEFASLAEDIIKIIDSHLHPKNHQINEDLVFCVEKIYYVSDKGLRNAPVAYGYLKSGIITRGMNLYILGLDELPQAIRVRSLEVFGQEIIRCEAGRSVAVLFEKVPKNSFHSGQSLLGENSEKELKNVLQISIVKPTMFSLDYLSLFGANSQISILYNMNLVNANILDVNERSENEIQLSIHLDRPIVILDPLVVLIGLDNNIISGRIR